tara:strand:+ start:903 stop:1874 length:972 start_codon:yes stop_codon:yes gene_type:complete
VNNFDFTKKDKSLLIVASDSWGVGAELDTASKNNSLYFHHLNKKLKLDSIKNLSGNGLSNDMIYEKVIHTVISEKDNFALDKSFVLIGWSSPERRMWKWRNEREVVKFGNRFTNHVVYNQIPGTIGRIEENLAGTGLVSDKQLKDYVQFFRIYNKYFWLESESLDRWVIQMVTLHTFLKSFNIKHLFYNNFYPYDSMQNFFQELKDHTEILQEHVDNYFDYPEDYSDSKDANLFSEPIKSGKKLKFDRGQMNRFSIIPQEYIYPDTMLNVLRRKYINTEPPSMHLTSTKDNNPAFAVGGHPNELGHKEIANTLYEHIKKYGMY